MYILKNAVKNLFRNRGRNFIIFLLSLLTLTSVTLSFAIYKISESSILNYKDSFHVDATIDYDWEKLEKDFPPIETVNEDGSITLESSYELPEISLEDYMEYADSEYVKSAKYSVTTQFASKKLTKVPDNLHENENFVVLDGMSLEELKEFFNVTTESEVAKQLGGEEALKQVLDMKNDCVGTLWGYTELSLIEEFANGENKLETGRFPKEDNECIVSSKFAEHNNLKIGDVIEISGSSKSDTDIIALTITGIYAANRSAANAVALGDAYGYIYTTFDTVRNSGFHWIYALKTVFELKDPESAKLFEKELYEKGLSEYGFLSYSNSSEEYQKNTEPLKNISHIAEIFTMSAGIIGAVIILLISIFNIRERKYEIGVLRAMGMKKSGVARGMIYESFTIMIFAFGISILISALLTGPLANIIVGDLTDISKALLPSAILLCAGMGFVLSIVSGLCAVFVVMRHEPMKILTERN